VAHIFRVDDRLIHGQVVVGWCKRLNLNAIIVVNDEVANDSLQKDLMNLAVPKGVKSFYFSLDECGDKLKSSEIDNYDYILLVNSSTDALTLVEHGIVMNELNIGGLHYKSHKTQYSSSLFLDDKDIENIKKIMSRFVKINTQPLPNDVKIDIKKIIG